MNRSILVPLDVTVESESILSHVQRIATPRDHIHFLQVVPPVHSPAGLEVSYVLTILDQAAGCLQAVREKWLPGQPGLDLVRAGDPAEQILGAALEKNINLIAMSTHGRSLMGRVLMGSVAIEIVRKAQLPVLLARPGVPRTSRPIQRILVALEGGETPLNLLETVKSLARGPKAEIILFHALPPLIDPAPQWALRSSLSILSTPEHRLQDHADLLEAEGYVAWPMVSEGRPVEEILSHIEKLDVDVVALSTRARTGLERFLEGSVAEGVLRRSPVAVLLQKPLTVRKSVLQEERHA